jgi:hypothetical protein
MKTARFSIPVILTLGTLCLASRTSAALYEGHAFTSSTPEVIAGGTLNVTDSGGQIQMDFTRGRGWFNEALVIYIDSIDGSGFAGTGGFGDTASAERACISGVGSGGRSTVNFASGFRPDYALVLGITTRLHGLYQLAEGGNESFTPLRNLSIGPNDGSGGADHFQTSFRWSDIGQTGSGDHGFRFATTYLTTSGSRYLESFEHLSADSMRGFNTVTFTDFNVYGVEPVPEMTNLALAIFGGLAVGGGLAVRARRYLAQRRFALARGR